MKAWTIIPQLSTFHVAKVYCHDLLTSTNWFIERRVEYNDTLEFNSLLQDSYRVVITQCFPKSAVTRCIFDHDIKPKFPTLVRSENELPVKLILYDGPQSNVVTIVIHIDIEQFPTLLQTQQEERLIREILVEERRMKLFYLPRISAAKKHKKEHIQLLEKQLIECDNAIQEHRQNKKEKQSEIAQLKQKLRALGRNKL